MPPSTSLETRVWARVRIGDPDECWPWLGSVDDYGYGKVSEGGRKGRTLRVHRAVWEMVNGPIPEGRSVTQTCGNIICQNPGHLQLATRQDIADKMTVEGKHRGGTKSPRRGSDSNFSVLSDDDVRAIKVLSRTGQYSQAKLAHMFNVSRPLISMILSGQRWGHIE